MSEPATDMQRPPAEHPPLLPPWIEKPLYAVLISLSIVPLALIAYSMYLQQGMTHAVAVIRGGLGEGVSSLADPRAAAAIEKLKEHPVSAFLYCNQALLQDEESDPRMVRALALRKAVAWGTISRRREIIRAVYRAITDEGRTEGDVLTDQMRDELAQLAAERRSQQDATDVERGVTDVVAWLAQGMTTPPQGYERRRLGSLLATYEKKSFAGRERRALKVLAAEWAGSSDAVEREAASAFAVMLNNQETDLSPEAAVLCERRAGDWETLYRQALVRLAEVSRVALAEILASGADLDHPHIYQYLSLLGHRYDEIRTSVAEGTWALRHRYFTVRFLAEFATKTHINPMIAVETERLTPEEHEREMTADNNRRMAEAIKLLGQVAVDYIRDPTAYDPRLDPGAMRQYVVDALQSVIEQPLVRGLVERTLDEVRRADLARPGGPLLFPRQE